MKSTAIPPVCDFWGVAADKAGRRTRQSANVASQCNPGPILEGVRTSLNATVSRYRVMFKVYLLLLCYGMLLF